MRITSKRNRPSENDRTEKPPSNAPLEDADADADQQQTMDEHGQLASEETLRDEIVSQFPQTHIIHCFGYGSGVFSQDLANNKHGAGMLDLILVVDDTMEFHRANLQRFPHHYAPWLRYGGPSLVAKLQRQGFPFLPDAHVLFHVADPDETNNLPKMKYGVVDKRDLETDLTQWESLYLAGRLHKPTLPIVSKDENILQAQATNLKAATAAALLLSQDSTLSWLSLYRQIASLSYTGDFRMQVGGEDPQKLNKLVQAPGQLQRFHGLYSPILESYETAGILSRSSLSHESGGIEWNAKDPSSISYLWEQLPPSLQTVASNGNSDALARALAAIVAPAARNQSFKGVFTLGFRKSIQYASAKLSKGLLSTKK